MKHSRALSPESFHIALARGGELGERIKNAQSGGVPHPPASNHHNLRVPILRVFAKGRSQHWLARCRLTSLQSRPLTSYTYCHGPQSLRSPRSDRRHSRRSPDHVHTRRST